MESMKNNILSAMKTYQASTGRQCTMVLLGSDQFRKTCEEAEMDLAMITKHGIHILNLAGAEVFEINSTQDLSIVCASNVKTISL